MSLIESNNLRTEFEASRYSDEFCVEHNIDRSISLEMVDIILTQAERNEITTFAWQDSVPNVDNDFGDYPYTCPNCHKAQKYKSKFCPECGVKMTNAWRVRE